VDPIVSLQGRTIVVTGAGQGIGKGIVELAIELGANVVAVDLNGQTLDAAVSPLPQARVLAVQGSVADPAVADRAVTEAVAKFGAVHGLVNNAGIIRREDAINFSEKDWDDVMNINIKSVFFMSQAVARQFMAQGEGGKIVNIASMLSYQGGIRVPSYTASKSGVMGITRLLANEWASKGINVNAIAPGYMATNNTAALRADDDRNAAILERIPAGRWGVPDDMMGPVVFLASSASDYINGYTVAVDGGWLAR
jgi:2-deoxy-D-gluconate 3-dehydrogenase